MDKLLKSQSNDDQIHRKAIAFKCCNLTHIFIHTRMRLYLENLYKNSIKLYYMYTYNFFFYLMLKRTPLKPKWRRALSPTSSLLGGQTETELIFSQTRTKPSLTNLLQNIFNCRVINGKRQNNKKKSYKQIYIWFNYSSQTFLSIYINFE